MKNLLIAFGVGVAVAIFYIHKREKTNTLKTASMAGGIRA